MKRALPLLLLLLVAPADAAAAKPCAAPNTTTVRKNDIARLYEKGPAGSEQLRGCLFSRGIKRSVLLAENFDDGLYETETWDGVRLWDQYAAWRMTRTDSSCKTECPPGYGVWVTRTVRDLASRRARNYPETFRLGRSFVITNSRVIVTAVRVGEEVQLRSWNGTADRLIDSGDIDPESLRVEADRISWVKDGKTKTQRL